MITKDFPKSTLGQKHNVLNYHVVCEASAEGILRVGKEDADTSLADLLTNTLGW